MRTITVRVAGEEISFPTNMLVLRGAEELSGVSAPVALSGGSAMPAGFVLGLVAAGANLHCGKHWGIDEVGALIFWDEADEIYQQVITAFTPDAKPDASGNADAQNL